MLNKKRTNCNEISKTESFLSKLQDILNMKEYSHIIHWNKDGKKIIITNVTELTEVVLPKFFKHRNYSSFVRQLNIYDFHKCKGISEFGEEFEHSEFNRKSTKEDIKRILPKNKKINQNMLSTNDDLLRTLLQKQEVSEKKQKELEKEIKEIKKVNIELKNQIENRNNEIVEKNIYLAKLKKLFTFLMIFIINGKKGKNNEEMDINELIDKFKEDKSKTKEDTKNEIEKKVDGSIINNNNIRNDNFFNDNELFFSYENKYSSLFNQEFNNSFNLNKDINNSESDYFDNFLKK